MDLKIFSLNCWGIAIISANRISRMKAIANLLANSNYDVVCLQEIWVDSDYQLIKEKVQNVLPYSHYFYSGVAGSGICIFSKHPIEEVLFHQWPVNGYIHKIHHGDWFGGKGVGLCKLRVQKYIVNVYSAHLHAEYNRACDEYQSHRVLQAFDTAQFIQMTSGNADLTVLAGDLNTEPGDLAYRIILNVPGLVDAFVNQKNYTNIATSESLDNSYTSADSIKKKVPGKRIDFIMYHPGSNLQIESRNYQLPLPHRVPQCSFSYSDHEAVEATLVITRNQTQVPREDLDEKRAILEESIQICNEAMLSLSRHRWLYWFFTLILFVLLITVLVAGPPFAYISVYHIIKTVLTLFICYTLVMATLWNSIEKNAVIAGKLAMICTLKRLKSEGI